MAQAPSTADALAAACAATGLDSSGAHVIYRRANTVYKLASPVVARLRYVGESPAVQERLTSSLQLTRWLNESGFPAVQPLDVPQPVPSHGYLVTFWHYIPSPGFDPDRRDIEALGGLLRELHALPAPPVHLPATNPLGSIRADAEACPWLTNSQRDWITGRCDELAAEYSGNTQSVLGYGLVHGDAHPGNLIHGQDHVVLCDWDAASHGPLEQDLIPVRVGYRYDRPETEWHRLCRARHIDARHLPLLPLLERMRELRALAPYLRLEDSRSATAEADRRISDLMTGTQRAPWQALTLT